MPRVSVVIPTYNRAGFVERAVLSAANQTFRDLEILVVDDCSTDDTLKRLSELANRYPEVRRCLRVLRQETNQGANPARNRGIFEAKGEFIAFLDSDDIWHPDKILRQIRHIEQNDLFQRQNRPAFCFTGRFRVANDYAVIARQFSGSMRAAIKRLRRSNCIGTLSSFMISTWVARYVHGFDVSLKACQDWDFFVRTVPYCVVLGVADPLTMYLDGDAERISGNPRSRLRAHAQMYRRHIQGRVPEKQLAEFYRNVAEDLEAMGKSGFARHFLIKGNTTRARWLRLQEKAFGIRGTTAVRARRYAAYARRTAIRDPASDEPYLRAFAPYVQFSLYSAPPTDAQTDEFLLQTAFRNYSEVARGKSHLQRKLVKLYRSPYRFALDSRFVKAWLDRES